MLQREEKINHFEKMLDKNQNIKMIREFELQLETAENKISELEKENSIGF